MPRNLDNHLRFALQLIALGLPMVVALNMIDLAERDGLTLDPGVLARELGVPVVPTVAVRQRGLDALRDAARRRARRRARGAPVGRRQRRHRRAPARARGASPPPRRSRETAARRWTQPGVDAVALHPVAGPLLLLALLFVMFQAVFAWSEAPIGWLEGGLRRGSTTACAASTARRLLPVAADRRRDRRASAR